MTFVKICGLTTSEHVLAARNADALGFVVNSPKSHRDLTHEAASALVRQAGPFQTTVTVTAERDPAALLEIVRRVRPHALQVPFRAGQAAFESLRAAFPVLRILFSCRPEDAHLLPEKADGYVLDAAAIDGYGGTGQLTDWGRARAVRESTQTPVLLAGGLTPENVAHAIRAVKPYGVDVSTGVETDKLKDAEKIRHFIANARSANL
jgi:phosphoribosylanthranilate isomerase